jgi:hypothetical protein
VSSENYGIPVQQIRDVLHQADAGSRREPTLSREIVKGRLDNIQPFPNDGGPRSGICSTGNVCSGDRTVKSPENSTISPNFLQDATGNSTLGSTNDRQNIGQVWGACGIASKFYHV